MDRRQIVAVTTVVLVVGVAMAGVTFDSATFVTSDQPVSDPAPAAEDGGTGGAALLVFLYVAMLVFAILATFFAIRSGRLSPTQLGVVAVTLAIFGIAVLLLTSLTGTRVIPQELLDALQRLGFFRSSEGANTTAPDLAGDTGTAGSSGQNVLLSLAVAGALAGLVGIAAVGIGRLLRRQTPTIEEGRDDAQEGPRVGRAAGRVADRLAEPDIENPIYEAWHEMATAVGVTSPASTTPAEFAAAAVEAGVDPADAETLTALFREVRYGDAPVTEDRVELARQTLRRIEASFEAGEADPPADDGGDG